MGGSVEISLPMFALQNKSLEGVGTSGIPDFKDLVKLVAKHKVCLFVFCHFLFCTFKDNFVIFKLYSAQLKSCFEEIKDNKLMKLLNSNEGKFITHES